jgi:hypothetical protein
MSVDVAQAEHNRYYSQHNITLMQYKEDVTQSDGKDLRDTMLAAATCWMVHKL